MHAITPFIKAFLVIIIISGITIIMFLIKSLKKLLDEQIKEQVNKIIPKRLNKFISIRFKWL